MPAQALGGQLKEFRNSLQIPAGVCDIDVSEISCELWQLPPDINACSIPIDELARCKTVAEVLEPRPAAAAAASSRGT